MNTAILSGKGGTGKTTVAVNLAIALDANYIDCDVEEPNGFLFINPLIKDEKKVMVNCPVVDKAKCDLCGLCVKSCEFNALAKAQKDIILFEKLCHSCNSCKLACPNSAISFEEREVGKVISGEFNSLKCMMGILNISEAMAPPVIKEVMKSLPSGLNIIDCAPGSSCNVVTTLRYVDNAIVVTEPTYFGLKDLIIAIEVVKIFNIPFGVVINKDNGSSNIVRKYCNDNRIHVIGSIPNKKDIAIKYSKGEILYNEPKYKKVFEDISYRCKEVLQWN